MAPTPNIPITRTVYYKDGTPYVRSTVDADEMIATGDYTYEPPATLRTASDVIDDAVDGIEARERIAMATERIARLQIRAVQLATLPSADLAAQILEHIPNDADLLDLLTLLDSAERSARSRVTVTRAIETRRMLLTTGSSLPPVHGRSPDGAPAPRLSEQGAQPQSVGVTHATAGAAP